ASISALNSASSLRSPSVEIDRMQKAKGEIVRHLTTEAKLQRLHNKLEEMKSALSTLSKEEGTSQAKQQIPFPSQKKTSPSSRKLAKRKNSVPGHSQSKAAKPRKTNSRAASNAGGPSRPARR
ncbi:MAG: hypothetical protein ABH863_01240, partial [Candidatus Micrarchaeota archaeon]